MAIRINRTATAIVVLVTVGYAGVGWLRYVTADIVMDSRISEATSPDKRWVATVSETTVEGLIATATVADVELLSTNYPTSVESILGVDTGGYQEDRPRVAWIAPDALQVTLPNLSFVSFPKRWPQHIRVVLRFEPNDPVARAAWLHKMELGPDRLPGDGGSAP